MTEPRLDRLAAEIADRELDALLVTDLINVRYLTGFTGTSGACVITPERRIFLTDFRYTEQAEAQVEPSFERVTHGTQMLDDVAALLTGRAGFDDVHMSVRTHEKLRAKVEEGVELVEAGGAIEKLRAIKEPDELRRIRAAAQLATSVLEQVLARGLAGRTEVEVARDISDSIRAEGGEGPAFPAIVASGAHGALPHAQPRDAEIPSDALVVIDWGVKLDGYCSDCTRTVATGSLSDWATDIYELVRRAQADSLAAVRAGASASEVDGVARSIIDEAGHGERFGHGLGHGVGLEVHEGPRLGKTSEDALAAGNVVSVEPGVYVPGEVGVRIEDLVAVTDDGSDVFTSFPKELVTV